MQLVSATAPVDILAPGEDVDVYLRRSPLRQQREHVRVPAGMSVAEILEFCEFEPARLYITINGHSIEAKNWPRVRVKPGATVSIVKVPGKGALKSILGLVVSLAAAIFAPYLLGLIAPALVGTAAGAAVTGLIGAGLTVAGSLALNALFPVAKPKQQATDETKTLYSIGGAQNENMQYGAVPEIFGVHRVSPPKAAGDYTEIVGNDQYLRQLFCVGYGPIDVSDIKIAETPIGTFEDVSYEVITNHLTQATTLYTKPVYEESVSVLLDNASGWIQRTTAENVDEISVDVSFPNGVYRYKKKNGDRVNYGVNIEVHYAVAGTGAWMAMGTISVVAASAQAVRRSLSVAVPRGQYDVRLWKSSADYTGDDTVSETAYWTAVRGRRNESVISFSKPLTLIALRIKATNELNGTVNQLNCIASPRIRSWNGSTTWVANQITRNPADHFRQVLQGNANARPVADASIDLESIQDWHAYCKAQGFTFDLVATDQLSVYDRLTEIAAAGRASVSFRDGKWGVVWDVAGSGIVQHFTPRNSSGFSSTRAYADLPHGWRVNFINRDNNYLNDERVVYDDGYTAANATKFEGLDFPGVTDTKLIWRHGRYHIAQLRLQRETYTLTTDFEHLVCTRGDRVRVNHDVVLWGLGAARVKAVSAGGVTLDDTLPMETGKTYSMRFRLATGGDIVRTIAGVDGEFTDFTFSDTGDLPAVGDLVQFGENGMESVVLRVKSIMPQADLSAKLELVDDAPAILTADTGTIPDFVTGIPPLVDYRSYAPTALSSVESIWTTAPPTSALTLSWTAPEIGKVTEYIVQYAAKGTDNWSNSITVGAPQAELRQLDPGAYKVRIRAIFNNGQLSGWLNAVVNAAIFATAPADVTSFAIAVTGDLATLTWDPIPEDTGISHYEIRYSPVPSALITWQSASLLRSQAVSQAQVAPLRGTYLIKGVNYAGLQSVNPAVIVSTIDGLTSFNSVETAVEVAPFAGTKDGTFYNGTALILDVGSDVFALSDFFEVSDFFLPDDSSFLASGYYYFVDTVDLGDIYTSRISAEIDAHGESFSTDFFTLIDTFGVVDFFGDVGSTWNVSIEISVTDDDPGGTPVWSDWATLVTGDVSARAFRFRALLESSQRDVSPVVDGLSVTIDMPDRVIAGNDLVIGTSGVTLAFNPAFKHLQGVSVAAQGLTTGDYYEITSKNEAGFTIIFKNAAGAAISRTLDYVAKGYGTLQ